jgi:putative hydrolase of the HAD superfamily
LPIAEQVDNNMVTELRDLINSRRKYLALLKTQNDEKHEDNDVHQSGSSRFSAVAFDLDGTLYPNRRFYWRLLPFVFKEFKLLKTFGEVRKILHQESFISLQLNNNEYGSVSFYDLQAGLMAAALKTEPALMKEKTKRLIYRGWEPLFKKVRLFSYVRETINILRDKGL